MRNIEEICKNDIINTFRFHQTASNAQALLVDESEVDLVTKSRVASVSAQKVASMIRQPNWASIKLAACFPLLLWHCGLSQLVSVCTRQKKHLK